MNSHVLEIRSLSKRFGDVLAVDDVSLTLGDGEILALVGPSGCGKSTLLRLVAGLLTPDSGRIVLGGRTVTDDGRAVPPEDRRVGVVFQDHALFPHLTVAENVAFGLKGKGSDQRVREVLALVHLSDHGGRYPHELSGGERQRVGLARALAPRPAAVLLDEPFASLDRNLRNRIRAETVDILRDAGAAAMFVTHDQTEALTVGDRVAVMRDGHIEQLGVPETVFHAPTTRFVATFLGEADFLPVQRRNGVLVTEVGDCPLPQDPAAEGEVMVRPHEVDFEPNTAGGAVVAGREFQGAYVLYDLRLESGRHVRSLQPHTVDLQVGARVSVRLTHGHPPAVLAAER